MEVRLSSRGVSRRRCERISRRTSWLRERKMRGAMSSVERLKDGGWRKGEKKETMVVRSELELARSKRVWDDLFAAVSAKVQRIELQR